MAKRNLTDRTLKALKAARAGQIDDFWDAGFPGFGVRVSDTGRKTFVLATRYPGSTHPTRRALGQYGPLTLEKARAKARDWLEQIRNGIDPAVAEEAARRAVLRKQADTFAAVFEEYLRQQLIGPNPDKPRHRKGREVERDFRKAFLPIWEARPITSITAREVRDVIEGIRDYGTDGMLARQGVKGHKALTAPAPGQARNLLSYLRTFFAWAIDREDYGLESSPCERVKAARLFGAREANHRILSDAELFALWRVTGRMGYPLNAIYRLLILTGLRLNEVADAKRYEFDRAKGVWTVAAERMKGKNGSARPHAVPITADIAAILDVLPTFKRGEYAFSTSFGEKPAWVTDRAKKWVDAQMLRVLRAFARRNGDDPAKVKLEPWVNHDIRRTLRSRLSELRVSSDVAEAVLAHVKPGIRGVYDRYEFFDEKKHALELWAARLRSIVEPPPANVVPLRGQA